MAAAARAERATAYFMFDCLWWVSVLGGMFGIKDIRSIIVNGGMGGKER